MIEVVQSRSGLIEEVVPHFVPISAVTRERPTHHRVECIVCGLQVSPEQATLTLEGYICRRHDE